MTDLSDKLTVFIIAIEKLKNYEECFLSIQNQTVSFKIELILDITPMHKAFQKMLDNCKTPYFVQVDEDMILDNNAIETLYNSIINSPDLTTMICYDLFDCHLQKTIEGVKIYKHDIFKKFPYENKMGFEMNQLSQLEQQGYNYKIIKQIIGKHSPYWTNINIYNRYYELIMRNRKICCGLDKLPNKLFNIFQQTPTKLNFFAVMGAFMALIDKDDSLTTKDYNKYKTENYKIIEDYVNKLKEINVINRKKLVVQLARIPCANSGYELSNLINTYSDKYQSRYVLFTEYSKENKNIPYRYFPYDLFWQENEQECLDVINSADIIHIHHDVLWNDKVINILKNKKVITTWYNLTNSLTYSKSNFNQRFFDNLDNITDIHTVIDQPLQKIMFDYIGKNYVPLIKYLFNEITKRINDIPLIIFAPTNREDNGIGTKKYNDVIKIINELKEKGYKFNFNLIEGVPYEENLERKRHCDILIDDVDPDYEKFHNSSLEAACFSAISLTNYTGIDYPFIKTNINNLKETLIKYISNIPLLREEQRKIVEWRKLNYTPKKLVKIYEDLYDGI